MRPATNVEGMPSRLDDWVAGCDDEAGAIDVAGQVGAADEVEDVGETGTWQLRSKGALCLRQEHLLEANDVELIRVGRQVLHDGIDALFLRMTRRLGRGRARHRAVAGHSALTVAVATCGMHQML